MHMLAHASTLFPERVLLDLGERKITFADMAASAASYARHFAEQADAPFVMVDCADVARYIAVFCACLQTDKTVIPFSATKVPFDELSAQLPRFAFIDAEGRFSLHTGQGTSQRKSGDVYCLFTSGTTGRPKGILVTQNNLLAYVDGIAGFLPEYEKIQNISAVFSPLFDLFYHDLLLAFRFGLTLHVPSGREKMFMHEFVLNRKLDAWFSTPTVAANILASIARQGDGGKQARIGISLFCGERLGAGLALDWAALTGSHIVNVYGPTETTIACTGERVDTTQLSRSDDVPIGRVFGGNLSSISGEGTLVIRGPQVARYLHAGEVDHYDTRDRVIERDGKLYYQGRVDGQMKIKGLRIEREELERVACSVTGVQYAKIQPIEQDGLITGFNVVLVGQAETRDVMNAFRQRYGGTLLPSGVQCVDSFATSTSGKAKV